MLKLTLTQEQTEVLAGAIESYLSDLRMEITDTDSSDYREMLKEQKQCLLGILGTLRLLEEPSIAQ